jgi:hypothetical protein
MAQCPECGARLRLVAASGGGVARPRVPGGWPDTRAYEMAQWGGNYSFAALSGLDLIRLRGVHGS